MSPPARLRCKHLHQVNPSTLTAHDLPQGRLAADPRVKQTGLPGAASDELHCRHAQLQETDAAALPRGRPNLVQSGCSSCIRLWLLGIWLLVGGGGRLVVIHPDCADLQQACTDSIQGHCSLTCGVVCEHCLPIMTIADAARWDDTCSASASASDFWTGASSASAVPPSAAAAASPAPWPAPSPAPSACEALHAYQLLRLARNQPSCMQACPHSQACNADIIPIWVLAGIRADVTQWNQA